MNVHDKRIRELRKMIKFCKGKIGKLAIARNQIEREISAYADSKDEYQRELDELLKIRI